MKRKDRKKLPAKRRYNRKRTKRSLKNFSNSSRKKRRTRRRKFWMKIAVESVWTIFLIKAKNLLTYNPAVICTAKNASRDTSRPNLAKDMFELCVRIHSANRISTKVF